MEAVRAFNNELSSLYETKPPISKAKMTAVTKSAIKAIKFYKHVVQSVEKFIQKCRPEYKVPGLYVIDSIVRQSRHQFGAEKDVFAPRFANNITTTFQNLFKCPPDDKSKVVRVLNLWQKNNVFPIEIIQPLLDMANPNAPVNQIQNNTSTNQQPTSAVSSIPSHVIQQSHSRDDSEWNNWNNQNSQGQANDALKAVSQLLQQNQEEQSSSSAIEQHLQLLQQQLAQQSQHGGLDSSLLNQIQNLTQILTKQEQPTNTIKFDKKLLDFDYGDEDEEEEEDKREETPVSSLANVAQNLLSNPDLVQQLQKMQKTLQQTEALKNELNVQEQLRQQLQEEFSKQMPPIHPQVFPPQYTSPDTAQFISIPTPTTEISIQPPLEIKPERGRSRSPPKPRERSRSRSSRSPKRKRRSRSPKRRRSRSRSRERHRRSRSRERERDREKEKERERERERRKKGLPPIKPNILSVCSTTLWLGHLARTVTDMDLKVTFQAFGEVSRVILVPPRGCAFICMVNRADASKALVKLKTLKLQGNIIKMAWAPGKGVKGNDYKKYWDVDAGVTFIPWDKLHDDVNLQALAEGGMIDKDTLPEELKEKDVFKPVTPNQTPTVDFTQNPQDSFDSLQTSQGEKNLKQMSNNDLVALAAMQTPSQEPSASTPSQVIPSVPPPSQHPPPFGIPLPGMMPGVQPAIPLMTVPPVPTPAMMMMSAQGPPLVAPTMIGPPMTGLPIIGQPISSAANITTNTLSSQPPSPLTTTAGTQLQRAIQNIVNTTPNLAMPPTNMAPPQMPRPLYPPHQPSFPPPPYFNPSVPPPNLRMPQNFDAMRALPPSPIQGGPPGNMPMMNSNVNKIEDIHMIGNRPQNISHDDTLSGNVNVNQAILDWSKNHIRGKNHEQSKKVEIRANNDGRRNEFVGPSPSQNNIGNNAMPGPQGPLPGPPPPMFRGMVPHGPRFHLGPRLGPPGMGGPQFGGRFGGPLRPGPPPGPQEPPIRTQKGFNPRPPLLPGPHPPNFRGPPLPLLRGRGINRHIKFNEHFHEPDNREHREFFPDDKRFSDHSSQEDYFESFPLQEDDDEEEEDDDDDERWDEECWEEDIRDFDDRDFHRRDHFSRDNRRDEGFRGRGQDRDFIRNDRDRPHDRCERVDTIKDRDHERLRNPRSISEENIDSNEQEDSEFVKDDDSIIDTSQIHSELDDIQEVENKS